MNLITHPLPPNGAARVSLSKGYSMLVDESDLPLLAGHSLRVSCTEPQYAVAYRAKRQLFVHRLITDAPEGTQVDHRNHDGLDNRRSNLRVCTVRQNHGNFGKQIRKGDATPYTSRYKGVLLRYGHRWHAKMTFEGKQIHLGSFDTEVEAALAYNAAALKYFGEFANLNVIEAEVAAR